MIRQHEMEVNKEDEEDLLRMKAKAKWYTRLGFRNELDKIWLVS